MRNLNFILITFISLIAFNTTAKKADFDLDIASVSDFFAGDPLDSWVDPKDERFKGIDLKTFFKKNTAIREELHSLRQKYIKKYQALLNKPDADFVQLSREMTEDTIAWIVKYLEKVLPPSVEKNELAFIGFGSMARGESGPFTDLEGTLVWNKDILGKNPLSFALAQGLSNTLDQLLGHPIYGGHLGLRLDEAEHSPFHKAPFAKNFSNEEAYCMAARSLPTSTDEKIAEFRTQYFKPFEGSWLYSGITPRILAEYTKAANFTWPNRRYIQLTDKLLNTPWYKWSKQFIDILPIKQSYIASVLANSECMKGRDQKTIDLFAKVLSYKMQTDELKVLENFPILSRNHIFLFGNKKLYDEFKNRREQIIDDNEARLRKKITLSHLATITKEWSTPRMGSSMLIQGQLPAVIDLKRQNYRFEEQIHTNLGMLFSLGEQNQADIIKGLIDREVFGIDYGSRALARLNQMARLRWKDQIKVKGQLPPRMHFISQRAYNNKLNELKAELKEKQKIINQPTKYDRLTILMNKVDIIELNRDLKLMPSLDPSAPDAIFDAKEIKYLKNTLIPEQAETYRRLVAFVGNKNIAPIKTAFSDSFKWQNVNLKKYGININR